MDVEEIEHVQNISEKSYGGPKICPVSVNPSLPVK